SALEAKAMGYLKEDDVIVFNAYELLHVAKVEARAMFDAGYRPPLPKTITVTGRYGWATIRAQLVNMRDGGFISAHDYKLGDMIAEIVTGGDVDQGSVVNEQWFLDMECKAFLELLNNPKSQERIMGMMQTGKPVRN
ncbi:MAG: 3-hydroxyacyl-CoA dehydrogenase, partial [Massilia sp.]|nr:3-hydroxyacyl-CoA dehydrogenase [Massilia sp.]